MVLALVIMLILSQSSLKLDITESYGVHIGDNVTIVAVLTKIGHN